MNIVLPEMTIELRESNTAHGIPEPDLSFENLAKQCQHAIQLNEDAKSVGWQKTTFDILSEYIEGPIEGNEIRNAVKDVFGFNNAFELAHWITVDMCSDQFNSMLRYCLQSGQEHKEDKGFLFGQCMGYLQQYLERLNTTMQKAFDTKYFYKVRRPLVYMIEEKGMDLSLTANAIHPGHYSYIAGHATLAFTALEVLNDVFNLTDDAFRVLFIAAYTAAMSRSFNLIHYPMDNTPPILYMNQDLQTRIRRQNLWLKFK
jgi:hypothetical protein